MFIIGSVIGYNDEIIVVVIEKGYFESRQSLIYEPFTAVYGIGAIIYYLILKKVKTRNKIQIFFITAILGGTTEYICSLVQEKAFGTVSWDYSNWLFNIDGRTTLIHCTYWGFAGLLYVSYIVPLISKIKEVVINHKVKIMSTSVAIFMVFNVAISSMAAIRQKERQENIAANSKVDVFLDNTYPDEYMDEVFENQKRVE